MAGDKSCLSYAGETGLKFSAFGFLVSAYKNAVQVHNAGALGVFTRTGGDIGYYGVTGVAFAATTCFAQSIREKDDHWNKAIGGAVAGAIAGARSQRIGKVAFGAFAAGSAMWLYGFCGDSLVGVYQGETGEEWLKRREQFLESPENMEKRKQQKELIQEAKKNYYPIPSPTSE
ncbi:hypothetical protein K502DRAFT_73887 [Neoconidiobolus thromboides FSU 785]|nr:hypothetical protein K502DRAFT_73887 [Neoconidiobolus thromboides FSU 785]